MPKTILIQDPDVLISLDLAQTVLESWPDTNVILCRTPPQVSAILSDGQRPEALILRQSLQGTRREGIFDIAFTSKLCVILTDIDEDEAKDVAAAGWLALDMPFSAAQVRAALQAAFDGAAP